jgi:hypothetical protein
MAAQGQGETPPDRVLTATRVLAAIIVPILFAAFIMLYLFPNNSGLLFAWPIKPQMGAMMLGGTYLGGAYFFSMVVLSHRWHTVRLGFWPVTAFAAIMGITTILHWDRFTHGHISFMLWALLYFTLPFIIPIVWYLNQRTNRSGPDPRQLLLSRPLALGIGIVGAVMAVASLILLVFPEVMLPLWPWSITPLTARALSAMFALTGLLSLSVAIDRHWSSARIPFLAQVISIFFILIALIFANQDILWSYWGTWTFIGGLLLELLLIGWAYLEARRSIQPAPQPGSPSNR